MAINEAKIFPIFVILHDKLKTEDFVMSGNTKTVEIVGAKIILDPSQPILDFGVKKTNEEYCQKELDWYLSMDLSIKGHVDDVKIWQQVADKDGFINSNYGWCIFSDENRNQFQNCIKALKNDKHSRRALMIYMRPSMHEDYCKNGMHDFMCTISNQFLIRDNKLISIYNIRSNDAIFGFFNDFYWACYVYKNLFDILSAIYPELQYGPLIWFAGSFHVYERHFSLLKDIVENGNLGG